MLLLTYKLKQRWLIIIFEIKPTHNIITERTEMAKALNFGKYKVLEYDLDKEEGSMAVVEEKTMNYGTMRKGCKLYCGKIKEGDGIFWLMNSGTMLSAHVSVSDWRKSVTRANAPTIKEGDEIAILVFSDSMGVAFIRLVKALKPTPEYSTALEFVDL